MHDDLRRLAGQHIVGDLKVESRVAGGIALRQHAVHVDHALAHDSLEGQRDAGVVLVGGELHLRVIPALAARLEAVVRHLVRIRRLHGAPVVRDGHVRPIVFVQEDLHIADFLSGFRHRVDGVVVEPLPALRRAPVKAPVPVQFHPDRVLLFHGLLLLFLLPVVSVADHSKCEVGRRGALQHAAHVRPVDGVIPCSAFRLGLSAHDLAMDEAVPELFLLRADKYGLVRAFFRDLLPRRLVQKKPVSLDQKDVSRHRDPVRHDVVELAVVDRPEDRRAVLIPDCAELLRKQSGVV